VIRHVFGEGVRPLAEVKVLVSPRECTSEDLQIDEFLLRHGAPLSIEKTLNRYGRTVPALDEKIFSREAVIAASRPESLQPSETSEHVMDNSGFGLGPAVSFRGDSPGAEFQASSGANGVAAAEVASLPNQFTVLQEEWVQLSPFGDFPHARGLQRMNRAAAEAMVAQFHSFRGRLGRLFGGVPFYVGHPDLPNSSETVDRKAYGWIMEIEAREEGLFGRVKWSDAGLELLRNAHFKFLSPYWEAREIGQENGRRIYQPIALLSAGLTNQPNIPVRPLANSQESEGRAPRVPLQDRAIESNTASIAGDDVRSRSPEAMENQESNVALAPRQMHTVSCTENLGLRRGELLRLQNRRDRIHECVLAKLRLGMNYDEAWEHVKREHAAWFEDQQ
jgi:hypothetical protein